MTFDELKEKAHSLPLKPGAVSYTHLTLPTTTLV